MEKYQDKIRNNTESTFKIGIDHLALRYGTCPLCNNIIDI